jgi:hypothetical protein
MKRWAVLLVFIFAMACATKQAPVAIVTIEPPPALPEYSFIEMPDGSGCLDVAGREAYWKEQELLIERNNYFAKKLKDMGAVFLPPPSEQTPTK